MCLHSTYSGVGRDSYLYIKKVQSLSTEKAKEKETTPPPLKLNPTQHTEPWNSESTEFCLM